MTYSWLPLSHDMGLIGLLLTGMAAGARPECSGRVEVILRKPETFLRDPGRWLIEMSELEVNYTACPGFALDLALRGLADRGGLDLSSLRSIIVGAERVRAGTLRSFAASTAAARFSPLALCPAYGLAEASLAVSLVPPGRHWSSVSVDPGELADGSWREVPPGEGTELVGNGPIVPGLECRVAASASGELGELQIRGSSLLHSYVGAEGGPGPDGWLATRDQGFLHGGELYVTGRLDDMIVVRGRNLYGSELAATAGRHSAVRTGCCAAFADHEGGYVLAAEPRAQARDSLSDVARELRALLSTTYGAAPSTIVFAEPGSLPKTTSGKPQPVRLHQLLADEAMPVLRRFDYRPPGDDRRDRQLSP